MAILGKAGMLTVRACSLRLKSCSEKLSDHDDKKLDGYVKALCGG